MISMVGCEKVVAAEEFLDVELLPRQMSSMLRRFWQLFNENESFCLFLPEEAAVDAAPAAAAAPDDDDDEAEDSM